MTYASGATDLVEIVFAFQAQGFDAALVSTPDAQVLCKGCGNRQRAGRYHQHGQCRTEGASDPADMALVVALECPDCGARGVLALKYGPGASVEEAELLRQLDG
jgi:hypothetical protein